MPDVPLIDVEPLRVGTPDRSLVAAAIDAACRDTGFFCVCGHGVDEALAASLEVEARRFFARPDRGEGRDRHGAGRAGVAGMVPGGRGADLGTADQKEGLYFGEELPPDDPRVRSGRPLHGANLFPERPVGLAGRPCCPGWTR